MPPKRANVREMAGGVGGASCRCCFASPHPMPRIPVNPSRSKEKAKIALLRRFFLSVCISLIISAYCPDVQGFRSLRRRLIIALAGQSASFLPTGFCRRGFPCGYLRSCLFLPSSCAADVHLGRWKQLVPEPLRLLQNDLPGQLRHREPG